MDTGGDSATRYYKKHCKSIELELGDAVDSAIEHEAKDPMLHVAQEILRKRDIRVPGISEVGPTHAQLDFK